MNAEITAAAGRWRVVFVWRGDRYSHAIERADFVDFRESIWTPLAESIEGTDRDDWPVGPPLQQVHLEERPRGAVVALAVGMAGRSHWSVSCLVDPNADEIVFDVACRVHVPPARLGSRYRDTASDGERIVFVPGDAASSVTHDRDSGEWIISHEGPFLPPFPQTIRWRYTFRAAKKRDEGSGNAIFWP